MITISLCMIVKNEENTLGRCLDSVKDIVDEIIIVDTGSTDNTKKIAEKYTDKIYDFEWIDDFSAARNYSFSKATMDYIMWLDADDVILEEDRKKLEISKDILDSSIDVVMMLYNVGFDDKGNVTLSYYRERLVKKSRNFKWVDPVHEYIEARGKILNLNVCITHRKIHSSVSDRNINIFRKMLKEGKELSPRNLFYYGRELYFKNKFEEAIKLFNKFLDTNQGWVEDNINACYLLAICYESIEDRKNTLKILVRSFEYDLPRAEICCLIGNYYFEDKNYKNAIFWYELATNLKKPENNWGFILHEYWDYIPFIQLCVCYDRLGDTEKAIMYNNKVLENRPNDTKALYNEKYFESIPKET